MTTGSALYIPPYKADDQDVVVELNNRFGAEAFTAQSTRTGMPVLWVARARLVEVLTFLRNLPKPYVMLYDLHGVDERLRTKRDAPRHENGCGSGHRYSIHEAPPVRHGSDEYVQ